MESSAPKILEPNGPSRVVCAMSGGVDSSVAAALLKEQGHEVVGLFMRNGIQPAAAAARGKQGCCSLDDAADARRVAGILDIPFYAVDFSGDFHSIIEGFADEYERGRTPNPCIRCNKLLKFGRLIDHADRLGAEFVATGHYGQVVQANSRLSVRRSVDLTKDQSYVLFSLDQAQLSRTLLPLGNLEKTQVRALAKQFNLPVSDKPDSQEICFVPDNNYSGLLERLRPGTVNEGDMVDTDGVVVGRHGGHQQFTIGQRKGIGGGFREPRYVVAIDAPKNQVVIGKRDELLCGGLTMREVTFSGLQTRDLDEGVVGLIQIRYQQEPMKATATRIVDGEVEVLFHSPFPSVTPGQAAVFYVGEDIGFGGYIEEARPPSRRPSEKAL